MSTGIILNVDGLEIPVSVVRKRVKNLNLRVRADGTVTLSIPQHLPLARAQEFLERKGSWIAERVRRNIERRPSPDFAGELPDRIPLWGKLVPRDSVQVNSGQDVGGQGAVGRAIPGQDAPGQTAPGQTAIDQAALDELYRTEVLRALPGIVERMEARIGVHAARWSVRVMKTRWGSCTPKTGAIRINARLAAYPPECLEFVVAHELVHLLEPSHNARFHALLDEFCPDNRHPAKLLREAPDSD
ncbi:M48 family metallopeptidase [Collinsella intestinalis]|uniref:M48 family metallopeptidase n=1 Tax=Collinsella intestinalis TaxID=147207 RepID=UPI0022E51AFA|nr:SprT family zinc-dependent metalloprotease [Collinsella intestinalis]